MKQRQALISACIISALCVIFFQLFRRYFFSSQAMGFYLFFLIFAFSYLFIKFVPGKKNRGSLDIYLAGLELSEEGILLLDQGLNIQFFNSTFASFLGASFQYRQSFYDMEIKKHKRLFDLIKSLLKRSYQFKAYLKETLFSDMVSYEVIVSPLDEEGFAVLVKDTTKNIRSISMGKEFISNATHELRTPITIIKGFVETLKDLPEISEDMLEDISEKILRSCNRMDAIVKNLLILTDLDHLSQAELKKFDVEALVDNCRHTLMTIFPKAKVSIHPLASDATVSADPGLLELALMNLMQNAVKYSPDPAQIDIYIEKRNNEMLIKVADRGQGIPEEFQKKIFDRFLTVDKSLSRKLGGAGLGLSIVKAIVDKHRGFIDVSSNEFGGSTFTISLPFHLKS